MISKKNKFQVGDLVEHGNSSTKGIVVEVKGDWVRFRVFERTLPNGKPYHARFPARKITLLATRNQVLAWALEKRKEQEKTTLVGRFKQKIKSLLKSDPQAPAASPE